MNFELRAFTLLDEETIWSINRAKKFGKKQRAQIRLLFRKSERLPNDLEINGTVSTNVLRAESVLKWSQQFQFLSDQSWKNFLSVNK